MDSLASPREVLAAELLHEGVVASRSAASPFAGPSSCGLGEGPELGFALTDKARALLDQLWPEGLSADGAARLREALESWVRRQDGLDRKRNHFMKDFRNAHGYDRGAYSPELLEAWERGLAEVYEEAAAARLEAARGLLSELTASA